VLRWVHQFQVSLEVASVCLESDVVKVGIIQNQFKSFREDMETASYLRVCAKDGPILKRLD
jgi:hypothetical protein